MSDTKSIRPIQNLGMLEWGRKNGLGRNCGINMLEFILCLEVPILLPFVMDIFLFLEAPPHHLHAHPLFLQHPLISPLSRINLNLKSSRFCLTVLTSNLILILSPLGFSRNAHLFLSPQSLTSSTSLSPLVSFTPFSKNLSSSSLKMTDRFFSYASPCFWNQHSLYLFVNLFLVPVPLFPTHLFLHVSLLSRLSHHSAHPLLPISFTPGLNLPVSQILPAVVSLLPPGQPSWTVSSDLLGFCF